MAIDSGEGNNRSIHYRAESINMKAPHLFSCRWTNDRSPENITNSYWIPYTQIQGWRNTIVQQQYQIGALAMCFLEHKNSPNCTTISFKYNNINNNNNGPSCVQQVTCSLYVTQHNKWTQNRPERRDLSSRGFWILDLVFKWQWQWQTHDTTHKIVATQRIIHCLFSKIVPINAENAHTNTVYSCIRQVGQVFPVEVVVGISISSTLDFKESSPS